VARTSDEATVRSTRLAEELAAVAERLRRATVQVRGRKAGGGSGVIWRAEGVIITNAHVARGPDVTVALVDGRILEAEVAARDPWLDLAVLTAAAADLPAARIGDSNALRVGELVFAVGNPFGARGALTAGIIHAIGPAEAADGPRRLQADIRLAPGNSGGPLADAQGRVIGINSMIAGGLALAVPSHAVERFLHQRHRRPRLGVTIRPVSVMDGSGRCLGLLVLEVASGSPAEKAGVLIGDVLIGVGGRSFNAPDDLPRMLCRGTPGDVLRLDLIRGGVRLARDAVVGEATDAVEAV
jgi:serine protease Do